MDWISTDDRNPEKDGEYLVCVVLRDRDNRVYDRYIGVDKFLSKWNDGGMFNSRTTHWMPLPDFPDEKRGEVT